MAEMTLNQLARGSKIECTTLLKRIKQSFPDYGGQSIDPSTAGKWIAPLRRCIPAIVTANNQVLTIFESIRLTQVLGKIADHQNSLSGQGNPVSLTTPKQTTTGGTASVTDRVQQSTHFTRGSRTMTKYEIEQRAKRDWDEDPTIRADFGTFEAYFLYAEAEETAADRRVGNGHA